MRKACEEPFRCWVWLFKGNLRQLTTHGRASTATGVSANTSSAYELASCNPRASYCVASLSHKAQTAAVSAAAPVDISNAPRYAATAGRVGPEGRDSVWSNISHMRRGLVERRKHAIPQGLRTAWSVTAIRTLLTDTLPASSTVDTSRLLFQDTAQISEAQIAVDRVDLSEHLDKKEAFQGRKVPRLATSESSDEAKLITLSISSATTINDLAYILQRYRDNLDPLHICAAINSMARISSDTNTPMGTQMTVLLHQLLDSFLVHLPQAEPRQLCSMIWAIGSLRYRPQPYGWKLILKALTENDNLRRASAADLSMLAMGLHNLETILREPPRIVWYHIAKCAARRIDEFTPSHLANLLSSFAATTVIERSIFKAVSAAACRRSGDLTACSATNLIWALIKRNFVKEAAELFALTARTIGDGAHELQHTDMVRLVWALARAPQPGTPAILRALVPQIPRFAGRLSNTEVAVLGNAAGQHLMLAAGAVRKGKVDPNIYANFDWPKPPASSTEATEHEASVASSTLESEAATGEGVTGSSDPAREILTEVAYILASRLERLDSDKAAQILGTLARHHIHVPALIKTFEAWTKSRFIRPSQDPQSLLNEPDSQPPTLAAWGAARGLQAPKAGARSVGPKKAPLPPEWGKPRVWEMWQLGVLAGAALEFNVGSPELFSAINSNVPAAIHDCTPRDMRHLLRALVGGRHLDAYVLALAMRRVFDVLLEEGRHVSRLVEDPEEEEEKREDPDLALLRRTLEPEVVYKEQMQAQRKEARRARRGEREHIIDHESPQATTPAFVLSEILEAAAVFGAHHAQMFSAAVDTILREVQSEPAGDRLAVLIKTTWACAVLGHNHARLFCAASEACCRLDPETVEPSLLAQMHEAWLASSAQRRLQLIMGARREFSNRDDVGRMFEDGDFALPPSLKAAAKAAWMELNPRLSTSPASCQLPLSLSNTLQSLEIEGTAVDLSSAGVLVPMVVLSKDGPPVAIELVQSEECASNSRLFHLAGIRIRLNAIWAAGIRVLVVPEERWEGMRLGMQKSWLASALQEAGLRVVQPKG